MASVTVTERAAEELRYLRTELTTEPDHTLRLGALPGCDFVVGPDRRQQSDTVVRSEGTDVLVIASHLLDELGDVTIDWRETPEGGRLVIGRSA